MLRLLLVSLSLLLALSGCKLPTVEYFRTVPTVATQQPRIKPGITIVLDPSIRDTLFVTTPYIRKLHVYSFRQSLAEGLSNAFKCYYNEVKIAESKSTTGMCLVLAEVNPTFNVKSTRLSRVPNSNLTTPELEAKVSYLTIVYAAGEEQSRVSGTAYSVFSTFDGNETDIVFKNGIKIMCEEIYRRTTLRY